MSKKIIITQEDNSADVRVQVESKELFSFGFFESQTIEESMPVQDLLKLIFELYDIEPSYDYIKPKKKFACKHCGHVYEKKQTCTQCLGKVKPVKTAKK